ncbi:MAG: hypothetical protein JRF63_11305, partial [Deltaproteobacteria bacterium]|nr:hypothetical protein [Deltaproteobacteria bacterium]
FNLVEGQYNESISLPGDYNMSLSTDRTSLTINFFNQIQDATLHAAGNYMATIGVSSNSYFVVETFTRDMNVTGV